MKITNIIFVFSIALMSAFHGWTASEGAVSAGSGAAESGAEIKHYVLASAYRPYPFHCIWTSENHTLSTLKEAMKAAHESLPLPPKFDLVATVSHTFEITTQEELTNVVNGNEYPASHIRVYACAPEKTPTANEIYGLDFPRSSDEKWLPLAFKTMANAKNAILGAYQEHMSFLNICPRVVEPEDITLKIFVYDHFPLTEDNIREKWNLRSFRPERALIGGIFAPKIMPTLEEKILAAQFAMINLSQTFARLARLEEGAGATASKVEAPAARLVSGAIAEKAERSQISRSVAHGSMPVKVEALHASEPAPASASTLIDISTWSSDVLVKLPSEVLVKLPPEALIKLPREVLAKLPPEVLAVLIKCINN